MQSRAPLQPPAQQPSRGMAVRQPRMGTPRMTQPLTPRLPATWNGVRRRWLPLVCLGTWQARHAAELEPGQTWTLARGGSCKPAVTGARAAPMPAGRMSVCLTRPCGCRQRTPSESRSGGALHQSRRVGGQARRAPPPAADQAALPPGPHPQEGVGPRIQGSRSITLRLCMHTAWQRQALACMPAGHRLVEKMLMHLESGSWGARGTRREPAHACAPVQATACGWH